MIKDTVEKIESTIRRIHSMEYDKKAELIKLLSTLKTEVSQLKETHSEHAKSIAGFADIAAHEATRRDKAPNLLKLSVDGLESSAKGFEATHPKLVSAVNDICLLLSRLGI